MSCQSEQSWYGIFRKFPKCEIYNPSYYPRGGTLILDGTVRCRTLHFTLCILPTRVFILHYAFQHESEVQIQTKLSNRSAYSCSSCVYTFTVSACRAQNMGLSRLLNLSDFCCREEKNLGFMPFLRFPCLCDTVFHRLWGSVECCARNC